MKGPVPTGVGFWFPAFVLVDHGLAEDIADLGGQAGGEPGIRRLQLVLDGQGARGRARHDLGQGLAGQQRGLERGEVVDDHGRGQVGAVVELDVGPKGQRPGVVGGVRGARLGQVRLDAAVGGDGHQGVVEALGVDVAVGVPVVLRRVEAVDLGDSNPMLRLPPCTGVPAPTPGLPPAAVVEVDELPDDDEQAERAVPAAPASTTAPPAAAPRAMKVRRLIPCSSDI